MQVSERDSIGAVVWSTHLGLEVIPSEGTQQQGTGGKRWVVEFVLSMWDALGLVPSTKTRQQACKQASNKNHTSMPAAGQTLKSQFYYKGTNFPNGLLYWSASR